MSTVSPPSIPPTFPLPFLSPRSIPPSFPETETDSKEYQLNRAQQETIKPNINTHINAGGASPIGVKGVPSAGKRQSEILPLPGVPRKDKINNHNI